MLDALKALYREGFPEDSEEYIDYFFGKVVPRGKTFTAERDGELASALYLVDKTLKYCGKRVKVPYVVAAATLTRLRGRKILEEVMRAAIDSCYAEKVPFLLLFPFSHDYYEKYSFTTLDMTDRLLPSPHGELRAVRVGEDALGAMYREYVRFSDSCDVAIDRTYDEFAERAKTYLISGEAYLFLDGADTVGYAFTDGGNTEECILNSDKSISDTGFSVWRYCGKGDKNVMGRVVNTIAAIGLYNFDRGSNFDIAFRQTDKFIPPRSYRLTVTDGVASVRECDGYDAEISTERLTQLLFGRKGEGKWRAFGERNVALTDKY